MDQIASTQATYYRAEDDVFCTSVPSSEPSFSRESVVAQQMRSHRPGLVHQGLIYPCTDLSHLDSPSYQEYGEGYSLTARNLNWYIDKYTRPEEREDVRASPALSTDLTHLPPATVIVAECDPLRDQARRTGEHWRNRETK